MFRCRTRISLKENSYRSKGRQIEKTQCLAQKITKQYNVRRMLNIPTIPVISGKSPLKQLINDNNFLKPVLPTPNNLISGMAERKKMLNDSKG